VLQKKKVLGTTTAAAAAAAAAAATATTRAVKATELSTLAPRSSKSSAGTPKQAKSTTAGHKQPLGPELRTLGRDCGNDDDDDCMSMTVAQLKAALKAKGLKVGGLKSDLAERLSLSTSQQQE
jgi:hypothetical protein